MSVREISSLQHPKVKHWVKLRESRDYRYASRRVVVSGIKLLQELSSHLRFRALLVQEGSSLLAGAPADETFHVSAQILKKVTGLENPEPVAAEIEMPPQADLSTAKHLLILDGVSDPGNLGTLLRTARGLGWDGAFLTEGSTDPYNEKALRAAKGATFTLPWKSGTQKELLSLLEQTKLPLIAADVEGKEVSQTTFPPSLALALGNEAHGLSSPLKRAAEQVAITLHGRMESLNVASAGAILMYLLRGHA